MIKKFVTEQAQIKGMKISDVTLVNGQCLGCRDMHLLNIIADGVLTSALVHQSDIDDIQRGDYCGRLEITVNNALSRLNTSRKSQ